MATADENDQQLFLSTVPQNIVVPQLEPQGYFGILDVRPDKIKEPPRFTEPATLEAMTNLGILSTDLVPKDPAEYEPNNIPLQIQIQIELERKRLATFERIITERQLILNKQMGGQNKKEVGSSKHKRKRKGKSTKKSQATAPTKKQTTKRAKSTRAEVNLDPKSGSKASKLPTLIRKKKRRSSIGSTGVNDQSPLNTNRRIKRKSVIDLRMERALIAKRKNEEAKVNSALSALKKVEAVEQRQKEMRLKQQALIKEKAQLRLERLAKKEARTEANFTKRKEFAKNEMMRQEQQYNKIKERERKKYEKEYQKRMQKVYGQKPSKAQSKSSLAELRKKMLASKLASGPQSPKPIAQTKPPSKLGSVKSNKNNQMRLPPKVPTKTSTLQVHRSNLSKTKGLNYERKPSSLSETESKSKPIVPAKGSHIPCFRPRK